MRIPASVREGVERWLERRGRSARIVTAETVGGGCVNEGVRLETDDGARFFLKHNASAASGMFEAEALGLNALRAATGAIEAPNRLVIPRPLALDDGGGGPAWLLLEWIEPGAARPDSDERLGRGLALLHGRSAHASMDATAPFGWPSDGWIGSLPQSNRPRGRWHEFWRDERIVPQLETARERGHLADPVFDHAVDLIEAGLSTVDAPALLHGDLWSGNAYTTADGGWALVDPAVYLGDGEVDLAMTELFGGFGQRFYAAYREVRPVSEAYVSHRRALYQLYYLLVHVSLFGAAYAGASRAAAEAVVSNLN